MSRKKAATAATVTINNLQFITSKLKPIDARIGELETELEPLQEQRDRLRAAAKTAAKDVWAQAVSRAVNEWKSSRENDGATPPTIEWVDERYSQIPESVFEFLEDDTQSYGRKRAQSYDLIAFFDEVVTAIEGEEEDQ